MPWLNLEEAEVIEEASRRVGKVPAQFLKEAGLAVAVAVLDEPARWGRRQSSPLFCGFIKPTTEPDRSLGRRKSCVSGLANIHKKYCVDGFR